MILAKIYYNIFTFKIHIKFSVKYNMSKKSISINPNFFKIGKGGKIPKEKKPKKQRPINTLKPNNVKKKLIEFRYDDNLREAAVWWRNIFKTRMPLKEDYC